MENVLKQSDIEQILKGITIPSPPQIIADLQMETARPDPDLNSMARMINQDVGLAGSVLKTVNSPFYGGRGVSSIAQAVMMLGLNTTNNIVNTLQLRQSMTNSEDLSSEVFQGMTRFWDSAIDVARSCQIIAHRLRFSQPDLAYMLGLFHNAGIPLLMQRFEEYPAVMREAYQQTAGRLVDVENQYFSTNHAVLSLYVARSWKLPVTLCDIIAQHHNGSQLLDTTSGLNEEQRTLAAILKLAEHLAALHRIIGDQEIDCEWQMLDAEVLDQLALSEYDYEDIASYANDQGIGMQSYFM